MRRLWRLGVVLGMVTVTVVVAQGIVVGAAVVRLFKGAD